MDGPKKKVIVVGAGISGLSAARKLVNHGGYDVTILEARPDRYGGRIWTDRKSFSKSGSSDSGVDLGAFWIHDSCREHPITQLALKFGLTIMPCDMRNSDVWSEQTGSKHSMFSCVLQYIRYTWTVNRIKKAAQQYPKDVSVQEAFNKEGASDFLQVPLNWLFASIDFQADQGAPIEDISVKKALAFPQATKFDGAEMAIQQGYGRLLDRLVEGVDGEKPLTIELGQVVNKVTRDDAAGTVHVWLGEETSHVAEYVIITVPLGLLKVDAIKFEPELSPKKRKAIQTLGFGLYNKVAFEFDKCFWPKETQYFAVAPSVQEDRHMMIYWFNHMVLDGRPILVAYIGGQDALKSEHMTEEELKQKGLARLSIMFGEATVKERKLVTMVRALWGSDRFARGSYSYPTVDMWGTEWDTLAEPEGKTLHFAGEHTNGCHYGSTQGAYLSGVRAANHIIAPPGTSSKLADDTASKTTEEPNKSEQKSCVIS